jgi:TonB dependent receptor/TonB-dependent Receptor Plug Domain
MKERIVLAAMVCLTALMDAPAHGEIAQPREYKGRRVVEVLRELQTEGVRILFSSTLVPVDLVVKAEPKPGAWREIAEQILAPHGLTVASGPGMTWLVVRATTIRPRPGAAPPDKRPPPTPETPRDMAPDALRIEEQVEVVDRAGDLAGVPSVHEVEVGKVFETAGAFENVFQVLSTYPGVAATDDQEGTFAVRGGGPEHNAIVFDGVQIHSSQRIGDFRASFVNPSTTGSIALDASGLDARYGGRLSSVTVLETRDGDVTRRLGISGSAGLTSGDVLLEGRLPGTSSGSWWATARGTYYKYVAKRFGDMDMPGFADTQFKVAARPSTNTRLSVLGLLGRETMQRPITGVTDPQFLEGNMLREQVVRNRLAVANLWWTPSRRLSTTTTLTGYSNASRYQDHAKLRPEGPFDRQIRNDDVGVRQRVSWAWSAQHTFDTGVEAHQLNGRWAMRSSVPAPHRRAIGPDTWGGRIDYSNGPIDARVAKTQVGYWLQDRMAVGKAVHVEPGVRVDWNSFTGETAVQPRLRVTRSFGRASVWAGLSWQAQTPGYETLQHALGFYDLTGPESSSLRNERSRQIVAGVEQTLGRGTTVRVEAYHRTFDHLLVQGLESDAERQARLSDYFLPPDLPGDSALLEHRPTIHPESTGTGRALGLEVLLQRHQGRVTGWVSYALSRSERELYGRTVPYDFDRTHAIGAVINVELTSRIRLSANTQYATGFPLTPLTSEVQFNDDQLPATPPYRPSRDSNGELVTRKNPNGYLRLSLLNADRMPAYARTDARVTFEVWDWLEVYGEVVNIFNRNNFHPSVSLGAGNFPGEYEVAQTLPRLPTYGVRVKF